MEGGWEGKLKSKQNPTVSPNFIHPHLPSFNSFSRKISGKFASTKKKEKKTKELTPTIFFYNSSTTFILSLFALSFRVILLDFFRSLFHTFIPVFLSLDNYHNFRCKKAVNFILPRKVWLFQPLIGLFWAFFFFSRLRLMLSYFLSIFLCYFFIFLSFYLCFLSLIYSQISLYLSSPVFAPSFVNCYYHHLPVSSLSLSLYTHTNKGNNKENKHTHLNTHKQPHEKEKEKKRKNKRKK